MDYIRNYYNLPFLKIGMRVEDTNRGEMGTVTGTTGQHLLIKLDGQKDSNIYHPTWRLRYCNDQGNTIKEFN